MSISGAVMKRIATEIKDLLDSPPEGIAVIPNDEDLTELTATIAGPGTVPLFPLDIIHDQPRGLTVGTPFEGGNFKMKLKIGPDFPQAPPKGIYIIEIYVLS
jgi:ubiquitin-conjugating enzyme E2 S